MFQVASTPEILHNKSLLFDRLSGAVACVSYDLSLTFGYKGITAHFLL